MNKEELIEYLGIVVDMEKECFLQQVLLAEIHNQISSLKTTCNMKEIEKPLLKQRNANRLDFGIFGFIIGTLIGAALGKFLWIILSLSVEQIYCLLGGGILLGILGLFVCIRLYAIVDKKIENVYEGQKKEYEIEIAQEQKRVQNERNIISYMEQEFDVLSRQIEQSRNCLKALYDRNIIFPKYRNFVMVSSLYEYFCSGRCSILEGHEGAYNILETEIRLDRIATQLDCIISQLEQIKNNQYIVYDAIQDANRKLNEILESNYHVVSSLRHIEEQGDELNARIADLQRNSRLNNYLTELSQKELAYMNRMGL